MKTWKPTVPDGVMTGDGAGGLHRVFNPPWWRLDRWLGWFLGTEGVRARIVMTFRSPTGKLVEHVVRVEQIRAPRFAVITSAIRKL